MAKAKRKGGARSSRGTPPPPIPPDWKPQANSREELLSLVERLPDVPGVYIMRDRAGAVVYVGKARRLRARVRQYFSGHDTRHFVPLLGDLLGDIETVVTANDKEALLLENTLIKRHRPRFNVKLRDDKQYLVLRLDPDREWPRLELVRRVASDNAHYFGPYHSAGAVRHALRVVNRHFKLRTCTDYVLHHRKRACLQHQIGRCPAPCVAEVDEAAYAAQVRDVALFLGGRHKELVADLKARMEAAAAELDFESAARLRDRIAAIETTLESQRVVSVGDRDQDIIGMYREGGQVEFVVMHVRQGKLLGTRVYSQRGMELPDPEVLHSFLAAYYADAPMIPDEVLMPTALHEDDAVPLVAWLREASGRKTVLLIPERGDKRKLLNLAQRNAASNFVSRRNQKKDADQALTELQQRFGLSRLPRVIECYDISHIQGSDTVASMVVFVDGVPAKDRYRSFKIRGLDGGLAQGTRQNDDFASMQEALRRRLRRGLEAAAGGGDDDGDDRDHDYDRDHDHDPAGGPSEGAAAPADDPWALPDLLVIDGGKGQLGRVLAAMQDMGVEIGAEGVDVISLAKERRLDLGHGREALRRLRARRSAPPRPDEASLAVTARDGDRSGPAAPTAKTETATETETDTSDEVRKEASGEAREEEASDEVRREEASDEVRKEEASDEERTSADDPTNTEETSASGERGVSATAHAEGSIWDTLLPDVRPGQALQDYVVATADEADAHVVDDGEGEEIKPERVFVPGRRESIRLRPGSSELHLLTRIRDEAHRFAITHHRKRRGKRALVSALDQVPGVGPATKRALVKHFGSIAAIKRADVEALKEVKGVGPSLAASIRETIGEG